MSAYRNVLAAVCCGVALGGVLVLGPASAQEDAAQATYQEIEQMFGSVPTFIRLFPAAGVAAAWEEMKTIQLNPETALDGKTKELIGLAVAAQIPCTYCIYAHTAAARMYGATDEEIAEAVAMAAITRHWSTFLNGMQVDLPTFQADFDMMLEAAAAH